MFFTHTSFIGIDPTAGQRPFAYVALDHELRLLALGQCDMEEILAFVAGQRQAVVAVCAPRRPNQGIMERPEVRQSFNPQPRPGRWTGFRQAEYQLRQVNISCPQTPRKEEDAPHWMQVGFAFYRRLESAGYLPYPGEGLLQYLEIYPHASYCTLLGQPPFPKHTFEGRIQRQLALFERDLHIPDPMDLFEEITRHRLLQGMLPLSELYTPAELDALVAAYTAYLAATQPEAVTSLGHPAEGLVYLPVSQLKRQY